MRKAIGILAVIGGGVLIAWMAASRAVSGETLVTDWPSNAFTRQFPDGKENNSAARLLSTVERLGEDLQKREQN